MSGSQKSYNLNISLSSAPTQITSAGLLQFLDISPDALITVNQAGMIVMVNRQAEALFGRTREELLGQQLEILLPQRFREAHIAHRERYFSAPLTRPMGVGLQLFGRRKDGMEFPVEISLRPLLLDGVLHAIGAIRDVTEQKMLEEQLRRKDDFLSMASHELKTPLTSLVAYTGLLHRLLEGESNAQAVQYLSRMDAQLAKLTRLIVDLLDMRRCRETNSTFFVALPLKCKF